MKVSLITAACNQGRFLRETLDSAITSGLNGVPDWEIIVVDDASDDDTSENLPNCVNLVRTNQRLGCSKARKVAAETSVGDVLVLTDPHCFFERGSLGHIARLAHDTGAIVQPEVMLEGKSLIQGGKLEVQRRGIRLRRPSRAQPNPALFGSIYAMSRGTYERLGGFPVLPGIWGRWEQTVTLTAYRLGIPIVVATKAKCVHRKYREHNVYPFKFPKTDVVANTHFCHRSCLPDSYESHWKTIIDAYYGPHEPEFSGELQSWIARHQVFPENETIERLFSWKSLDKMRAYATTATPRDYRRGR